MATKQIQSAGYGSKSGDVYHNQFLNTGDILASALRKTLTNKNIPITANNHIPERGQEDANSKKDLSVIENVGKEFAGHAVEILKDVREDLIALFQEFSTENAIPKRIEGMIRKLEEIGYALGVELEPFDPLKNMSGLKSGEALENAEKVVANTLNHYKLFSVSSIKTYMGNGGPTIELHVFGEQNGMGFEVSGSVTAQTDFNGNEAIDYVYSPEGGLMSIKARSQGMWEDVSDSFVVNCKVKRYKLGETDPNSYSAFLGEKIIAEGKEKLVTALKINKDEIKFGKCRVFSTRRETIDLIRNIVRINKT